MSEIDADSNASPSSNITRGDSESFSDGEGSVACSNSTEDSVQDSRKRSRPTKTQTQVRAWLFEGEITTDLLPSDSDSATGLDEDEANLKFLRLKSHIQAELGANFEKLRPFNFPFYIFCHLLQPFHNLGFCA